MSQPTSFLNKSGFSLIELMAAMFILSVGLLGLLQSLNLVVKVNLQNQLRDQAVIVSEKSLNGMKAMPYENITGSYSFATQVSLRGALRNYSVEKKVEEVSSDSSVAHGSKQLSLRVWWRYLGTIYEHNVSSAIGKEDLSSAN